MARVRKCGGGADWRGRARAGRSDASAGRGHARRSAPRSSYRADSSNARARARRAVESTPGWSSQKMRRAGAGTRPTSHSREVLSRSEEPRDVRRWSRSGRPRRSGHAARRRAARRPSRRAGSARPSRPPRRLADADRRQLEQVAGLARLLCRPARRTRPAAPSTRVSGEAVGIEPVGAEQGGGARAIDPVAAGADGVERRRRRRGCGASGSARGRRRRRARARRGGRWRGRSRRAGWCARAERRPARRRRGG